MKFSYVRNIFSTPPVLISNAQKIFVDLRKKQEHEFKMGDTVYRADSLSKNLIGKQKLSSLRYLVKS